MRKNGKILKNANSDMPATAHHPAFTTEKKMTKVSFDPSKNQSSEELPSSFERTNEDEIVDMYRDALNSESTKLPKNIDNTSEYTSPCNSFELYDDLVENQQETNVPRRDCIPSPEMVADRSARLSDLCPSDKAKLTNLMKEYSNAVAESNEKSERLERITYQNRMIIDEINETKRNLSNMLKVAKEYKSESMSLKESSALLQSENDELVTDINKLEVKLNDEREKNADIINDLQLKLNESTASQSTSLEQLNVANAHIQKLNSELEKIRCEKKSVDEMNVMLEHKLEIAKSSEKMITFLERQVEQMQKEVDTMSVLLLNERKDGNNSITLENLTQMLRKIQQEMLLVTKKQNATNNMSYHSKKFSGSFIDIVNDSYINKYRQEERQSPHHSENMSPYSVHAPVSVSCHSNVSEESSSNESENSSLNLVFHLNSRRKSAKTFSPRRAKKKHGKSVVKSQESDAHQQLMDLLDKLQL